MSARIFIRGVGAVSALGDDWPATVAALARGVSAVRPIERFDTEGFPCRVAAAMRDAGTRGDRRIVLMMRAAAEAIDGLDELGRVGVFMGAESGLARFAAAFELSRAGGGGDELDHERFGAEGRALIGRFGQEQTGASAVAHAVAVRLGARGPVETVSLACASSSAAVAQGARAIALGECDTAVCGGVGADVDPLVLAAFGRLGALSERGASRPFDARRDGFVLGEGAVALVLSRHRGRARSEIAGVGLALDAHHLTAPEPSGRGARRAMRAALDSAGVDAVGYVQAHGTSTPLNDAIEAAAIRDLVGETVPVASVKGALGHWIAGAGALGIACANEAVTRDVLLPTAGLERPDAECRLDHVMGEARTGGVDAAMANAFGFGGANCAVVVRRCHG